MEPSSVNKYEKLIIKIIFIIFISFFKAKLKNIPHINLQKSNKTASNRTFP